MGMRSQLVVNIPADSLWGRPATRVARHYQWVWGGHLIDRLAQLVKFLEANFEYRPDMSHLHQSIPAVYGVNFRTGNAQGLGPDDDLSTLPLDGFDSEEGVVVVNITATETPEGPRASYEVGIISPAGDLVTAQEYMDMYAGEFDVDRYADALLTIAHMRRGTWFTSTSAALAAADAMVPQKD